MVDGSLDNNAVMRLVEGYGEAELQDEEETRYFAFRDKGLCFVWEYDRLESIEFFDQGREGYSGYRDPLPYGLEFSMTQEEVHEMAGAPSTRSRLSSVYDIGRDGVRLHIKYAANTGNVCLVCLMPLTKESARREIKTPVQTPHRIPARCLSVYKELFGAAESRAYINQAWDNSINKVPPIAILHYPPETTGEKYHILATAGMCAQLMKFPKDYPRKPFRLELLLLTAEYKREYADRMIWLAEYPFRKEILFDEGESIHWIDPLVMGSELRHYLFLKPPMAKYLKVTELLEVGPEPTEFLWVVPITEKELECLKSEGLERLLKLFEEKKLSPVLDEKRKSLV